MADQLSDRQVTGIVFIVLGLIALGGYLSGVIVLVAGVALLVYGILGVMNKVKVNMALSVVCIVAGALLVLGLVPILAALIHLATIVIGIVLIVVGILKLAGKMD